MSRWQRSGGSTDVWLCRAQVVRRPDLARRSDGLALQARLLSVDVCRQRAANQRRRLPRAGGGDEHQSVGRNRNAADVHERVFDDDDDDDHERVNDDDDGVVAFECVRWWQGRRCVRVVTTPTQRTDGLVSERARRRSDLDNIDDIDFDVDGRWSAAAKADACAVCARC